MIFYEVTEGYFLISYIFLYQIVVVTGNIVRNDVKGNVGNTRQHTRLCIDINLQ